MASLLNPYISFSDTARPALEFYQGVFGGELALSTFGEFGQADSPIADKIMHGRLETPSGFTLMAADTPPDMDHQVGNNIAVSLSGDDTDQLRGYWDKLSAGGTVTVPLGHAEAAQGRAEGAVPDRGGCVSSGRGGTAADARASRSMSACTASRV